MVKNCDLTGHGAIKKRRPRGESRHRMYEWKKLEDKVENVLLPSPPLLLCSPSNLLTTFVLVPPFYLFSTKLCDDFFQKLFFKIQLPIGNHGQTTGVSKGRSHTLKNSQYVMFLSCVKISLKKTTLSLCLPVMIVQRREHRRRFRRRTPVSKRTLLKNKFYLSVF